VIPEDWQGFEAERIFREVVYHIKVTRKGRGNSVQLTVDGKRIDGHVVPLPPEGAQEVQVLVEIG